MKYGRKMIKKQRLKPGLHRLTRKMRVLSRRPLFIDGSAVSKKSFMIILQLFFDIKIRKFIFTHIFETWVFVNRLYDLRPKVGPVENSKMSRQNNLLKY